MLNALRLVGVEAYEALGDSIDVVAVLGGESGCLDVEVGVVEVADDSELVVERCGFRRRKHPFAEFPAIGVLIPTNADTDSEVMRTLGVRG